MRSFPRKLTIWKPSINNAACFAIAGPEHHHPILTNPNTTCWYANSPVFWICSSAFFAASIVAFSCLKSISYWKIIDSFFWSQPGYKYLIFKSIFLWEFVKVKKDQSPPFPGSFLMSLDMTQSSCHRGLRPASPCQSPDCKCPFYQKIRISVSECVTKSSMLPV